MNKGNSPMDEHENFNCFCEVGEWLISLDAA